MPNDGAGLRCNSRSAVLVAVLLLLCNRMALADPPPSQTDPIYDVWTSVFGPSSLRPVEKVQTLERLPIATAELKSDHIAIGAPAWATLRLRNVTSRTTYRLSPPYVGNLVASVGVWRARPDPFAGLEWGALREIVSLNKTYRRYEFQLQRSLRSYEGVPTLLKPGESIEAVIPLNVAQQVNSPTEFGDLWWFGGVGFTEPGRYRVYIQYANLDDVLPANGNLVARTQRRMGEPVDVPFQAIIAGPIDLTVVPPPTKDVDKLVRLIREWEVTALVKSDAVTTPNPEDVESVLADLDPAEQGIRDSLLLTRLRGRFSLLKPDAPDRGQRLQAILDECDTSYRRLLAAGDPLAGPYGLTECYVLRALGREDDVTNLAKQIGTPDAAAFVAAHK